MTNAEKFRKIFKESFQEVWAKDFLAWLNAEYEEPTTKNDLGVDCNNCKNNVYKGDGIAHCATSDGMCHFESKTEDCISRDAVKYYIQAHIHEIITESGIDKNAHTNGVLRALLNGVDTMPSVTPQLSVPEVTALAEWTEKLTKASEDAYNKGYADGMKAQEPRKGHWIGQKKIGFGEWKECIVPLKDGFVTDSCSCSECGDWLTGSDEYQCSGNFCPNCGADMREIEV